MAAPYPTNNNQRDYRPNVVFIEPNPNEEQEEVPERIVSAMERTAQYVSGLNPNVNSYSSDHHGRHSRHTHPLPSLTIRRHIPGSNDPSLQRFPVNLQQQPDNITSSTNVHVTVRRNPVETEKTIIQPIIYPVHVYVPTPIPPQYPTYQPTNEIQRPALPMPTTHTSSPVPPHRQEARIVQTKSLENQHRVIRSAKDEDRPMPILTSPSPSPTFEPRKIHSNEIVIEEYDDYDEYYRVASAYDYGAPKKVIAYETAPGLTTRERENEQMNERRNNIYVTSPKSQTVTYRVS